MSERKMRTGWNLNTERNQLREIILSVTQPIFSSTVTFINYDNKNEYNDSNGNLSMAIYNTDSYHCHFKLLTFTSFHLLRPTFSILIQRFLLFILCVFNLLNYFHSLSHLCLQPMQMYLKLTIIQLEI